MRVSTSTVREFPAKMQDVVEAKVLDIGKSVAARCGHRRGNA
jgi:hypothetical protein